MNRTITLVVIAIAFILVGYGCLASEIHRLELENGQWAKAASKLPSVHNPYDLSNFADIYNANPGK